MLEIILLGLIGAQTYFLYYFYSHYKETVQLVTHHAFFIELLDYNNLSLELSSRQEAPSLEEEAMLHTLEQNLKEKADYLGLMIPFPERPTSPHDQ